MEAPLPTSLLPTGLTGALGGILHVHVAFDWGEEINLSQAASLRGGGGKPLPRRRRTPSSFEYRPLPVSFALEPVTLSLAEVGTVSAAGEATVFDFAGVSVALQIPLSLDARAMSRLAAFLAEPAPFVQAARKAVEPLYHQLLPGIQDPHWNELTEEYFVFQLPPGEPLISPADLLGPHAGWLAGLVDLDSTPLSSEEVAEALRVHISYSPEDLIVANWAAAFLLDRDCDETLQVIEFANLLLLEYRCIDNRLDDYLDTAYPLIHGLTRSRLPFWKTHSRPLRLLGELNVEATSLFERSANVLKLVGDQYLARLYGLLGRRFHLPEWERSIQRKLEVLEGSYQVLSDQAATFRAEFLEWTVIVLIFVEIVLSLLRH